MPPFSMDLVTGILIHSQLFHINDIITDLAVNF